MARVRLIVLALLCGQVLVQPAAAVTEVARRAMIVAALDGRATRAALDSLAELAGQGDVGAADTLAFVHTVGRGIPRDLPTAFRWYMKAATLGHPEAMVNGVLVWRKMKRAEQAEAEKAMRETLPETAIGTLKERWAEAVETIRAREDAAKIAGGKGK